MKTTPLQPRLVGQFLQRQVAFPSILILLVLLTLTLFAALPVRADDFTHVTNNGTITITGYTGPGSVVTIPESINGLPVTSVGHAAATRTVEAMDFTRAIRKKYLAREASTTPSP